jgi:hypothetical protein
LAYAWESTYRLALVCKRFWIITKSRHYWAELAKHALKDIVPKQVLSQVNLAYFLKDTDPSHLILQALFKKPKSIEVDDKSIEFSTLGYIFDINWYFDPLEYSIYKVESVGGKIVPFGLRQTRVFLEDISGIKKVVWHNNRKKDGSTKSIYHYCEVQHPGLTLVRSTRD